MIPIHLIKGNLLYSKLIDLILISSKNTLTETSRLIPGHKSGYCYLAKLTHKITYHKYLPQLSTMKDVLNNELERIFHPVSVQPSSAALSELVPWMHE